MGYALESKTEFQRLEYQSTFPKYDYRKELSGLCDLSKGAKVLDAGCGSGVVSRYLAQLNPTAQVIGCDFSQDRVSLATETALDQKISNLSFEVQDLTKPTFSDSTFDFIVCRYVLQHILPESRHKAVSEFMRCLKPGGKLVLIDFDGTLYNLYPQPPFVQECLETIEKSNIVDLRIGRKLPFYLSEAGFQISQWRIETIECRGESMDQEYELMEGRLENAVPFFGELLGLNGQKDLIKSQKFIKEYLQAMKDPRSVLFYNKFIAVGQKTPMKLVKS